MRTKCSICRVPGCNRPLESNGFSYGKKTYKTQCSFHDGLGRRRRHKEYMKKCSLCGWDGPCDLHRVSPGMQGGTYQKDNVQVVCPNCHRLIHKNKPTLFLNASRTVLPTLFD